MGLTVNGVAIAEERVAEEMGRLRSGYVAYVGENGGEASEAQLREWSEENLIEGELLRQEAAATQPEPSEERARQWLAEQQEAYAGLPEAERLARARDDLRVRRLQRELRKRVARPSDDEVRREYDSSAELFMAPELLRVSHVCRLIGPPGGAAKADAFLELFRLKADLDSGAVSWFEALERSDTFAEDRGVFDAVARDDLPKDAEEALFALSPGEVSAPVELGGSSLHLFRVLAKDPPEKIPFERIRERLRDVLFERACNEALERFLDALKERASIRREEA